MTEKESFKARKRVKFIAGEMEREGKARGEEGKKQEFLRVKLKRGILVGKRGSKSSPSPTWKYGLFQTDGSLLQEFNFPSNITLSARQLGANFWEIHPLLKFIEMKKNGEKPKQYRDKQLAEHLDRPPQQTICEDNLEKPFIKQHHHPIERNGHNLQASTPASYSSSMEMAPYRPALAPSSSLKFKGGIGESYYNLKTSSELLKVLNRIWSLEKQHTSTISLVTALKKELDHSRAQTKDLLQEKKIYRDDAEKKMTEDRFVRKSKESDQIKNVVQSLIDELRDERRLRKHSESHHQKISRELLEVNSSFSRALKELERERSARILLEDLCDQFAKGVKDYEQEVRLLRQKHKNNPIAIKQSNRLILHLSESWLDERMQMKQEELHSDLAGKKTVVEKLSSEIETVLQAKGTINLTKNNLQNSKEPSRSNLRWHSLESLNEAASAPRRNEEDSVSLGLHNVELNQGSRVKQSKSGSKKHLEHAIKSHVQENAKTKSGKTKVPSSEAMKEADISEMQRRFEEGVTEVRSCKDCKSEHVNADRAEVRAEIPSEKHSAHKLKVRELLQEDSAERKNKERVRSKSLPAEVKQLEREIENVEYTFDPSKFTGPASPVEKWTSTVTAPVPECSESSKRSQSIKENTLKAKLREARLETRQARQAPQKVFPELIK